MPWLGTMTKSELIERISANHSQLSPKDVELAVKEILEHMSWTLSSGARIEIRGFGSFALHYRVPRIGRNPKTGKAIPVSARRVVTFKVSQKVKKGIAANAEYLHGRLVENDSP